jgi:c(7)-type cytochrome triheme protein
MKLQRILAISLALVFGCVILRESRGGSEENYGGIVAYPGLPGSPGPVLFSHRSHGEQGAGYACAACHADESTGKRTVTMNEIRMGRRCGACHDGAARGPRTQRPAFPVEDCGACHMPAADIVIKLNRMDPVAFSHVRHLGADSERKVTKPAGFSCIHCHPDPFERGSRTSYGMEVPHESGACATCHNGRKRADGLPSAFAATTRCLTCHKIAPHKTHKTVPGYTVPQGTV